MTTPETQDKSAKSEHATDTSTPDALLAQKVIDALVSDGLVSELDAASLRAGLAAGTVDSGTWKLALENKLERGGADERK
ncbi:MAG: hypothetical protein DI536_34400 [Archangium gephyra]|uniref:Uncharacterized protein n=1 Tax=Archangium gephyra TaxID=48 RepID=A0A2W5SXM5_9BACT|nr:MAG: hypothetical protein DI536_34400 [Archangium gephyra]